MRNSSERFIKALETYLKKAFTERVAKANEEDPSLGLVDIALWQDGYTGVLSGLTEYPGCIVMVNGKTLTDTYSTTYQVIIGIGLSGDDVAHLEKQGRVWEDILEDVIRSDWSLGGAAIDTALGVRFSSDSTGNVYVIQAELSCDVDLGGYVYAGEDEGSDGLSEVRLPDEGHEGDDMPEVPEAAGADDREGSEEDDSL